MILPSTRPTRSKAATAALVVLVLGALWGSVLHELDPIRTPSIVAATLISVIVVGAGIGLLRVLGHRDALIASLADSRERHLEAQRMGKIGHWVSDLQRGHVSFSDQCFAIMGIEPEPEITIERALSLFHPEDRERYLALRYTGGDIEVRVARPDGKPCWVHIQLSSQRDATGALVSLFGVVQDITERKQAEIALRASEERYRLLVDGSREGIYDRDYPNDRIWLSTRVHQLLGLPDGSLNGDRKIYAARFHPDDHALYEQRLMARLAARESYNNDTFRVRHADGTWRWMAIRGRLVYADDGTPLRAVGTIGDITVRKTAELALLEANRRLVETERLGRIGSIVWDCASDRTTWSDSLFELRGVVPRASFSAAESMAFVHADDLKRYLGVRDAAIAARHDYTCDIRIMRPNGAIGWEHVIGHPQFDAAGALTSLHMVVHDITEIRAAEQALRTRERQLAAILDNAPVAIHLKDRDRRYLLANRLHALSRGCTVEQMIGRTDDERLGAAAAPSRLSDEAVLRNGEISRAESPPLLARPGVDRVEVLKFPIIGEAGEVIGLAGFTTNVTERRRIEDQLRQAAKMEAVGRLASGIAHDFNNMVGAITGFSSFLVEDLPAGSPEHGYAVRIAKVCQHAKDVVRQILAFSRADTVEDQLLDLREVLAADAALVRAAVPASTALTVEPGAEALVVRANPGQLHQVTLNLCRNASDALGGRSGTVSLRLAHIGPAHPDRARFDADGDPEAGVAVTRGGRLEPAQPYAALTVVDTGCGMSQATLNQIFEPFFTTKSTGLGTGLGLAVINGIVTARGGAYRVTSQPGHGSAFTIYLPLVDGEASATRAGPAPANDAGDRSPGGTESILVVDDERDVADMLAIGLERLGYEVTCCNDPVEALRAVETDPGAWDLVITDQSMPGLTGGDLAARIKAIVPACPIILYSARADGLDPKTLPGVDRILSKQVPARSLAEHVRALLDGARATHDKRALP